MDNMNIYDITSEYDMICDIDYLEEQNIEVCLDINNKDEINTDEINRLKKENKKKDILIRELINHINNKIRKN